MRAVASWDEVISQLEADLDATERALSTGTSQPSVTSVAPTDLGPIPHHLRERAWSVHDRGRAATEALARAAAAVAGELRSMDTRSAGRPAPLYVDGRW